MKTISNIFVPIIPAIIASGILQGVNNIILNMAAAEAKELGKNDNRIFRNRGVEIQKT